MLGPGAVLRNSLCSLRSRRSDNRSKSDHEAWACCAAHARPRPCASRHGQRGVQPQHGPSLRSAPNSTVLEAERSDGPNGLFTPLRLRLRRRFAPKRSAGVADVGALCVRITSLREVSEPRFATFCLLSCACKKVGRPAGASPGQRKPADTPALRTTGTYPTSAAPHPSPLPGGAREQGGALLQDTSRVSSAALRSTPQR